MTTATLPAPAAEGVDVRALVARAQAGDADAFAAIYERYVGVVYQFVYYKVRGNRQLAEDLTSEVFLRAMRGISRFTWQGRDFGAWLITIARNLVVDHYKSSRARLEQLSGEVDAGRVDTSGSPESDPEAAAVTHATNLALLRAVNRLKVEQRECVLMRFWLQLSVAETAAALKI